MHKAEDTSCGDALLDKYPHDDHSLELPDALVALYPVVVAELAAERKQHHEESLRLANDNKELETKETYQVQSAVDPDPRVH
jgi:hypothetical protein